MARHTTITDEQILDAARDVFLENGYNGRTAEIAERAGVSQGTIFKRFPTKEALFLAALEIKYPPDWYPILDEAPAPGEMREYLVRLAIGIVSHFVLNIPRTIALAGKGKILPSVNPLRDLPEPLPLRDLRRIKAMLDREIALDHIAPCDTARLSEVLLGSLAHHPMLSRLTNREMNIEKAREYAEGFVDLLWFGIKPK